MANNTQVGFVPVDKSGDTMTGILTLSGAPAVDLDAATKKYVDDTVPVGGGANVALSNLAGVAINASLISSTDVTDNLGALAIRWNNVYTSNISSGDTAADTLTISAFDVDGASNAPFITLTSNNTPTCVIDGAVTGTTQAPMTTNTTIATTKYCDDAVAAAAPVAGANTALSNLAAVAVNTSLISDTDVTDNLGSLSKRWNNIYGANVSSGDTAADVLTISAYDVDGAASAPFITLTSNNTPTCVLASGVTGTTQAQADNSTKIATTAYVDLASGASGGGSLVLLSTLTAAASATIDFENVFTSTYNVYVVYLEGVIPATDAIAGLYMRVGTTAAPTWQTTLYSGTGGSTFFSVSQTLGGAAGESVSSTTTVFHPSNAALFTAYTSLTIPADQNAVFAPFTAGGGWKSATAVTSLRFYMATGNISSGNFRLYGVKQ